MALPAVVADAAPARSDAAGVPRASTARVNRRVWAVWALLFFNVLSYAKQPTVVPIPHKVGQLLTQGALALAFLLALSINRRVRIRVNLFLALYTALAVVSLAMSIRFIGLGSTYRAVRLVGFVAVLWMLTPWWGRRDHVLLRSQVRFLVIVMVTTFVGLVLSPGKALAVNFGAKRLTGALWPIPPTQIAHYTAELTGLTLLMWLCGMVSRRWALLVAVPAFVGLLATHTRTALLALVLGLLVGTLSLVSTNRRVRRGLAWTTVVLIVALVPLAPVVSDWLVRGQSTSQLGDLSGRTKVWPLVLAEQRPDTNKIFGSGLSNGSLVNSSPAVDGLPIDSSWVATYQDQGLVGIVLEALMFLSLLTIALLRPRGPARALALFLIVYCLCASFTETGMGEASTYLLDLTVAASLLVPAPVLGRLSSGSRPRVTATPAPSR